jgi:hypothetical protein
MSDEDSPNQTRRDVALRELIKAAHRFLDYTKDRRELQDMEEYRDLGTLRMKRHQPTRNILDRLVALKDLSLLHNSDKGCEKTANRRALAAETVTSDDGGGGITAGNSQR